MLQARERQFAPAAVALPVSARNSPCPELRKLPRERWAAAMSEDLRSGLSGFLLGDVVRCGCYPRARPARARSLSVRSFPCEATGEELVAGWGHPVPLLGLAGNPTWRFGGVRVSLVENRFVGGSQCPSIVGRC
jgi:hypothetical protein